MISLVVCIKRKPGLSRAEFSRHWRDLHAPLLLACTDFSRHILGYVQHHLADDSLPGGANFGASGDYDGIAVLTFEDVAAMERAFSEPRYLEDVRPDEPRFIDIDACLSFITTPFAVKGGGMDLIAPDSGA